MDFVACLKQDPRRMNIVKKNICLVLVIMLVASMFTACGTGNPVATTQATSAGETVNSATTVADKNSEAFTISVSGWFFGDLTDQKNNQTKYTEYAISKYKEIYPNATVQINNLASEKYLDVLKAKMASASADEVIFHQNNLIFSKAGYLADLSGFDFVPNLLDAAKPSVTYQGKIYSAPQTMATFGMFYNKQIFSDNAITIPLNWTEFLTTCEKLKNAGVVPLGSGYKDAWVVNNTFNGVFVPNFILAENPNFLVDLYNRKVKINSPEMKNAIAKFVELVEKGYYPQGLFSTDWMASGAEFGHGKQQC
jgi:raffinose/stachyose/melibiose transport system substrate-binding protein